MDKTPSFNNLFESYKLWVCNNPNVVTDVETVATWSSYFIAGKINKSPVVSELVYAVSKLLSLYNDRLIHRAYGNQISSAPGSREKLKLWLSVLHYSEVFIELLLRKKWGSKGKWTAATILQVVKCASSLALLYRYKEMPILHPPIPPLQRKKFMEAKTMDENFNSYYTLKRSGRVLRRVEGSTPIAFRDWQPAQISEAVTSSKFDTKDLIVAETLHIVKPLIHLASIGCFGDQSWKQFLVSFVIDITSMKIYSKHFTTLTTEQKLEISRRKLGLLLYLLRSPVYNKYSEAAIRRTLTGAASRIPLMSLISNPILQYLNHWQDIYFYMWTS